jgi:hypothetical protein
VKQEKESKRSPFIFRHTNMKAKISVFLICLIISSFIWFLIKMSKEYSYDFVYHIEFNDQEQHKNIINASTNTLVFQVNMQGFKLLRMYFGEKERNLSIDVSALDFKQKEGYKEAVVKTIVLFNKQIQTYKLRPEDFSISNDFVYFRTKEMQGKKIPVKLNADIDCEESYKIAQKIDIKPDSVYFYASEEVLQKTNFVETELLKIQNLSKSTSLPLSLQAKDGLLSTDKVLLEIVVEKYTEKTQELPIEIRYDSLELEKKAEIRIFPSEVELRLHVPVSQYKNLKIEELKAYVFFNQKAATNERLKIQVGGIPDNVELLRIMPETVEFIILK